MYEPNVVGDWQEYDEHAGLRVRVHRLEAAEPPRGRDDAAEGLTYFRVRVTVENRGSRHPTVHLEDGQIDVRSVRTGRAPSSTGATRSSSRASTSTRCAGPPPCCTRPDRRRRLSLVDVQVQLRVDDDWADRRLWAGGIGLDEETVSTRARSATAWPTR